MTSMWVNIICEIKEIILLGMKDWVKGEILAERHKKRIQMMHYRVNICKQITRGVYLFLQAERTRTAKISMYTSEN